MRKVVCLHGTEALYLGRGGQGPEAKAGGTPVLATRPLLTLGGRGGGKEGGRGGGREVWREEGGVEAHRGLHHPGLHGAPDMAATVHVEPVVLQRHLGRRERSLVGWQGGTLAAGLPRLTSLMCLLSSCLLSLTLLVYRKL